MCKLEMFTLITDGDSGCSLSERKISITRFIESSISSLFTSKSGAL